MKLLFAGTPEFAALHLKCLIDSEHQVVGVITQPDKPGKRGKKPIPSAVKVLALQEGLTVIQPNKLTVDDISQYDAQAMVVVAYGQILRPPVLETLPFGCINVHGSMLPRWRGAAPIQRAILTGDTQSGVCIIQMNKGLDTGPILASKSCEISKADTSATLALKLARLSTVILPQVLSKVATGKIEPCHQSETGICYANKIDKSEAEIDWSLDSDEILRNILGFNPDPIAFSWLKDLRVKIWEATCDDKPLEFKPGSIVSLTKQGLVVACGTGSITITRLQLPLGKGSILDAADLLNARKEMFSPGTMLGAVKVAN
ncbi:MAG: methionyl-tRNA formyltransferase [Marinovum sp.]|nr:methionyl-tRNA formyltransferase [Marinovum sp.]